MQLIPKLILNIGIITLVNCFVLFSYVLAGCGNGEIDFGEDCDNGPYNGMMYFNGQYCSNACELCIGNVQVLGPDGTCIVRGSSDRFGENVCGPEYIGDINGDYNGDGTGDVRYEDGGNVNIRYGVTNYDCAGDILELYYKADFCHLGNRVIDYSYRAVNETCCADGSLKSLTGSCGGNSTKAIWTCNNGSWTNEDNDGLVSLCSTNDNCSTATANGGTLCCSSTPTGICSAAPPCTNPIAGASACPGTPAPTADTPYTLVSSCQGAGTCTARCIDPKIPNGSECIDPPPMIIQISICNNQKNP